MALLDYNTFYLVGIKGVAMTTMAQLLIDAGKQVSGCDFAEEFVTKKILDTLQIKIDIGFTHEFTPDVECVIYTAAHSGKFNPIVVQAESKKIPVFSHAQAQADLFNQKKGIAVCGVGGKSTVSAMISWIFQKTGKDPSFAVGVGNIPGLEKTAQWNVNSEYFIAEADEYVTDPSAPKRGEVITPRFSFLHPFITVCTNIKFDHPDVYEDFEHTKSVFFEFFNQINKEGTLILNYADMVHNPTSSAQKITTFGKDSQADFTYSFSPAQQIPGKTIATVIHDSNEYSLTLLVPGEYNVQNALAAIAACKSAGIPIADSITALQTFASTQRRFEHVGTKNGVIYYDDYAHHPDEIKSVIAALNAWYKDQKKIIVFQPHTYSRTKQLLHEFIHAFGRAQEVYFLDIFASARESFDSSISSDTIVAGIKQKYPHVLTENLHDIETLSQFLQKNTQPGEIVLTLGAGDIYKVHDTIQ
ncbi:MAG: UDP-N-acetylmuramate--L-alanine ligase [Patescibacteria group bacterium]|nr:MAG: UDP-N-acetylmuramate--L-alanine ligase [Patescibacteria group bacterium]